MSRVVGNVKWYDTKKGYGFVTLMTPELENTGNDIFVHFSNINVDDGYRRLFPGEYVEFKLGQSEDGRSVCLNVSGLFGGNLLCQNEEHRFKVFPRRRRDEEDQGADVDASADADASADVDASADDA
jgi:CspA family cold shock protein